MKNMTLSTGKTTFETVRERTRSGRGPSQHMLGDRIPAVHARQSRRMQHYDAVLAEVRGRVLVGRKLTRDEMNER